MQTITGLLEITFLKNASVDRYLIMKALIKKNSKTFIVKETMKADIKVFVYVTVFYHAGLVFT